MIVEYSNVCVESFGYELPPHVVTSDSIEEKLSPLYKRLKLPEGRLELMSGVSERRLWEQGFKPSQGASLAGEKALSSANWDKSLVGALINGSISKDCLEPATASIIHHSLGLSDDCLIMDISNACLGLINSIMIIANLIETGQIKSGLAVACECAEELYRGTFNELLGSSKISRQDMKDHFASLTTGSGAVAVLLCHKNISNSGHLLQGGALRNASKFNDLCVGGKEDDLNGISMKTNAEVLLNEGCMLAKETWADFKKSFLNDKAGVDHIFTHQVGQAHRKLLLESLDLPFDRDFPTVGFLGNVGSVSLPISAAMGVEKNPPEKGNQMAFLGIGSGLNCSMLSLLW